MAEDNQNPDPGAEVAEPEVPAWVPEKFRSNPEQFGEAYSNLERAFHESNQQRTALEQNVSYLTERMEAIEAQPAQADVGAQQQQLQDAFDTDPIGTMAWLAQQSAAAAVQEYAKTASAQPATPPAATLELTAAHVSTELSRRFDDWDQYKGKVGEYLGERQHFLTPDILASPQRLMETVSDAYETVKAKDLFSGGKTPEENLNNLMQRMKLQAQSAEGAAGRPSPAETNVFEEIRNAPAASYADLFK